MYLRIRGCQETQAYSPQNILCEGTTSYKLRNHLERLYRQARQHMVIYTKWSSPPLVPNQVSTSVFERK